MKKVLQSSILSKVLAGVLVSGIFLIPTAYAEVTADVTVPATPVVTTVVPVTESVETLRSNNLVAIKARGALLIRQRVNSLTTNAQAIASAHGLSVEQKAAFSTFFSGKIAELNALDVKIKAGVDASSTKPLVTSIFTDFRIYAIVIPQTRLEKRIYELQNHASKLMTDTFVKIQVSIDAAKAGGKDITVWQKTLDDAKTLVASDTAKLPTLLTQIAALKPSDYGTTSKTTIEAVNVGVKAVARDFESLRFKIRRPATMGYVIQGKVISSPAPALMKDTGTGLGQ